MATVIPENMAQGRWRGLTAAIGETLQKRETFCKENKHYIRPVNNLYLTVLLIRTFSTASNIL